MVRAKFAVADVQKDGGSPDGDLVTVTLRPVVGGSAENDRFFAYTPGGSILLSTLNPAASVQFELGQEFYVDFTRAEEK